MGGTKGMRKGYCIDCKHVEWIKAKNRCERHYRRYYYECNQARELEYQANRRAELRRKRDANRIKKMQSTRKDHTEVGRVD